MSTESKKRKAGGQEKDKKKARRNEPEQMVFPPNFPPNFNLPPVVADANNLTGVRDDGAQDLDPAMTLEQKAGNLTS